MMAAEEDPVLKEIRNWLKSVSEQVRQLSDTVTNVRLEMREVTTTLKNVELNCPITEVEKRVHQIEVESAGSRRLIIFLSSIVSSAVTAVVSYFGWKE